MITWLKLLIAVVAVFLGVFAVTHDFKDENKKLTKAGYVNILFFILLAGLNYFAQEWENEEEEKTRRANLDALIHNTEELLNKTTKDLDAQFAKIAKLNTQIDSNLTVTESKLREQLEKTAQTQDVIAALTGRAVDLSQKTSLGLDSAIGSLSKIDNQQKSNLENLNEIAGKTENSLSSINKVLAEVNSIVAPVAPIQFTFKIKYKLDNTLYDDHVSERIIYYKDKEPDYFHRYNDIIPFIYEYDGKKRDDPYYTDFRYTDYLVNKNDVKRVFNDDFEFGVFFYDNLKRREEIVNYCGKYTNHCPFAKMSSEIYYQVSDTSLIKVVKLTFDNLNLNLKNIKSISELIDGNVMSAYARHNGKKELDLRFNGRRVFIENGRMAGFDPHYKYQRKVKFQSIEFMPFFEIRYGKDYQLSKIISSENAVTTSQKKSKDSFSFSSYDEGTTIKLTMRE